MTPRKSRHAVPWLRLIVAVAAIALAAPVQPGVRAATPADNEVVISGSLEQWVEVRKAYGLEADPAAVSKLALSTADAGSPTWGIPLTSAELAALDLSGRSAFVTAAHADLIPYVRSLPSFAGVWVDQANGGDIVVQLVNPDAAAIAAVGVRAPRGDYSVRIEKVSYTRRQLEAAVQNLALGWTSLHPELPLVGVVLDTVENRVRVEVEPGYASGLPALAADLAAEIGVDVVVAEEVPGKDVACTRDDCIPMRAGIRVRDGSISGGNWCTLGFFVREASGNVAFLTAGHCYKKGVGNTWYHKAYGKLGAEIGTAYGEDGYDVMKVNYPDAASKSEAIVDVSGSQQLSVSRDPIRNEGVCFSGAKTDAVVCGTVTDDFRSWVSETCDCNVWGGDTNLAPIPGDSGAPLYSRVYITSTGSPYWLNTPIGIVDHENGYFAWVTAAEWALGVSIWH